MEKPYKFEAVFGIYLPRHYFNGVVLPNWQEFLTEENHLSVRHAINLVVTAYHLHEWVFQHHHKNWPDNVFGARTQFEYRKKLKENGLKDIYLLHDMATMSKHFSLSRQKGDYRLSSPGQLEWGKAGFFELVSKFESGGFCIELEQEAGEVVQRSFEWMMLDYIEWWKDKFLRMDL